MSSRLGQAAIALFVAVAAFGGGAALVVEPTGDLMRLPLGLLKHSPFTSYLIPGIVLFVVIGGSQLAAGVAHLLKRNVAPLLSMIAGVLLIGWLVVQIAMIRELHGLQVLMGTLALAELALSARALGSPEPIACEANATAFLAHHRIAFLGLSTDPDDFSRAIAKELRTRDHEIVGINPHAADEGVEGFVARITDLPDAPRAALLMVPPAASEQAVEECIAAGVQAIWFHKGAGPGSSTPAAIRRAQEAGMTVVADACPMMFIENAGWLHRAHRNLAGYAEEA